jgi:hypothetical protein
VSNGSGISRGDRNRKARLGRLRVLVPVTNATVGIDLADKKQMVVVTDHDSKVLARRTFRCRAWDLGAALDWAGQQGPSKGFTGVTVSCEPTGYRWRVLGQLAAVPAPDLTRKQTQRNSHGQCADSRNWRFPSCSPARRSRNSAGPAKRPTRLPAHQLPPTATRHP